MKLKVIIIFLVLFVVLFPSCNASLSDEEKHALYVMENVLPIFLEDDDINVHKIKVKIVSEQEKIKREQQNNESKSDIDKRKASGELPSEWTEFYNAPDACVYVAMRLEDSDHDIEFVYLIGESVETAFNLEYSNESIDSEKDMTEKARMRAETIEFVSYKAESIWPGNTSWQEIDVRKIERVAKNKKG